MSIRSMQTSLPTGLPMEENPRDSQRESQLPPSRGRPVKRQGDHSCRYCSKQYTTSTWLDNHLKTKHCDRGAQRRSQSLAEMIHSRQGTANNATLSPQSLDQQELQYTTLMELQVMSSSLRSLLPLVDNLVALLQERNGVPPRAHSVARSHPHDLKRRASSQDSHRQNKRQVISASASELPIPRSADRMHWNDFECQNASPVPTMWEEDHIRSDNFENSLAGARCRYPEQTRKSHPEHSQASAFYHQVSRSEFPQQQRQPSFSPTLMALDLTCNATQMSQAFSRQQPERLSPCAQPATYPHGASPAIFGSEWTPLESTKQMADSQLQKSLDLPIHEPSQHLSPLGSLQQRLNCPQPTVQNDSGNDFGNDFGQIPKQYDFLNVSSSDQPDFISLLMQSGEALEGEITQLP